MIVGGALLLSALILVVMGEFLRAQADAIVITVLRYCALADGVLGSLFLFVGLRKTGES